MSTASARAVGAPPACSARLPFQVDLGPYRLDVHGLPSAAMFDRRRRVSINLEAHRIELREDLGGWALAGAFFEALVRLSHFSKGCQQGCVEEAYTHSLATGLVEFAQRNPVAWLWFNLLLSAHLPGRPRHDRVAGGAVEDAPPMPRRVLVAGQPVVVRQISRGASGRAFGWYDYGRHEVQLCAGLSGCHLPIVAAHELTHAVHHIYGLRTRDRHPRFVRAQVAGWLGIIRDNPGAWRWWVWAVGPPADAVGR